MTSPQTGGARWIPLWLLSVLAVIGIAGCAGDTPRATTSSTAPGSAPTFISERISWSPAHVIPSPKREHLQEALARIDGALIVPTSPDPAEGANSAEVTLQGGAEDRTVTLVLRNGAAVFSLKVSPGEAPCARRLQDNSQSWRTESVRGIRGCALVGEALEVSFLEWTEHGHWLHAEWLGIPMAGVLAWLSDWQVLTS